VLGRNELFADASRSVGPSAAGVVVARDQLRLRWTRAMTPRFSVLAGLRGTHDDDVNDDSAFQARSYATGDVGLQWRWQEEFSLRAAYDYTWQEFDDAAFDATSNGFTISFLYQPLQRGRVRND
jgi:outer membrane receptor protein involved in Fe transport